MFTFGLEFAKSRGNYVHLRRDIEVEPMPAAVFSIGELKAAYGESRSICQVPSGFFV